MSETKPMPTEKRHGTNRRIEQRNKTGAPKDLAGALHKTHRVSTILVECVPAGWNNEEHKIANRDKRITTANGLLIGYSLTVTVVPYSAP